MALQHIPLRGRGEAYRVVIETPRGSRNKYGYEPELGTFLLKKVLPEGHVFPFDFGFLPGTRAEDGDPIDVLVMMDAPAFPGCVVECRLLGVMQARQTEGRNTVRNDRFIAVATASLLYRRYRDASDIPPEIVEQIGHFFVSYNEMSGRRFQPLKVAGATAARKMITAGAGHI